MIDGPAVLALSAALAVGAAAAWLALRAQGAGIRSFLETRVAETETALSGARAEATAAVAALAAERERASRVTPLEAELGKTREESARLRAEAAALKTQVEEQRRANEEKLAELKETGEKLQQAFRALAAEALKSSNESFLQLAQQHLSTFQKGASADLEARQKSIETVVTPVRETLARLDLQVQGIEKARQEAYGSLKSMLEQVDGQSKALVTQTTTLATALKSSQTRGNWGELQLRRIVELAGMLEHCDFAVQETTEDEAQGRQRPDLIVHLPGGRRIVVDSKCPLAAFLEAMEASGDKERAAHLEEHAAAVRRHIAALGSKAYWKQVSDTVDFVVLFLPGEAFFAAALSADPGLLDKGADSGVVLASPTSLIALLKAVSYGWRQQTSIENAQKIAEAGRDLYDKVCDMIGKVLDVGEKITTVVKRYNEVIGTLDAGLIPKARSLADLGAKTSAEIPETSEVTLLPRLTGRSREMRALSKGERPEDDGDAGGA